MNDEYNMLRKEIDSNLKQMHQYFALTITALFVTLALIFDNSTNPSMPINPNIFSIMFAVLVCVAARVKSLSKSNMRISTYMEIFLEPNMNDRNWETRMYSKAAKGYSSHNIDAKFKLAEILIFRVGSTYSLLGIIIYALYIFVLYENFSWFYALSGGIFNTIALWILIHLSFFSYNANHKFRDDFIEYWKDIKAQEEAAMADPE
ncbi:MAG: hypothetical protein FWC93_07965 [Defluviitaleaceae bacterium]|nr:hypothetical protein [Defluviitaleaceae bacterium]